MAPEYHIDNTDSQVPVSDNYLYPAPQYPEVYTGWFLNKETGLRDSSTQISSIFRLSGKIKLLCHLVSASAPFLAPDLNFSQWVAPTTSWGWIWLDTQGQFLFYSFTEKRLLIKYYHTDQKLLNVPISLAEISPIIE